MISDYEILLRLFIAVIVGGMIGFERELKNQPAGLRTHMIVTLGAALIMILSKYGFDDVTPVTNDPARLAAQVISGIGFLGAGTIIVHKNMIRGLTTAASLWTSACIGLAIGAGFYVGGLGAAVLLLMTLFLIGLIERKLTNKKYKLVYVKTLNAENFVGRMEDFLETNDISLRKLEINDSPIRDDDGRTYSTVCMYLKYPKYADSTFIISEISKIEGVKSVTAD